MGTRRGVEALASAECVPSHEEAAASCARRHTGHVPALSSDCTCWSAEPGAFPHFHTPPPLLGIPASSRDHGFGFTTGWRAFAARVNPAAGWRRPRQ
eukprot:366092-Chlamydomonas_euryale.AAC.13